MNIFSTATAALLLAPYAAFAQDPPAADCAQVAAMPGAVAVNRGSDTVHLAQRGEAVWLVCYVNGAARASESGPFTLRAGDMEIGGRIEIGGGETLHLTLPPGWATFPADLPPVPDGEALTVMIVGGMM